MIKNTLPAAAIIAFYSIISCMQVTLAAAPTQSCGTKCIFTCGIFCGKCSCCCSCSAKVRPTNGTGYSETKAPTPQTMPEPKTAELVEKVAISLQLAVWEDRKDIIQHLILAKKEPVNIRTKKAGYFTYATSPDRWTWETITDSQVRLVHSFRATPLHFAFIRASIETIIILLKADANPDIETEHGQTPRNMLADLLAEARARETVDLIKRYEAIERAIEEFCPAPSPLPGTLPASKDNFSSPGSLEYRDPVQHTPLSLWPTAT